ncbi:MAG TPA: fluoride efflux transporter CrcB [Gemmatimonadaceae bacterium]|nr:fluoride efflux transporter CrcB [Gemmatimonadaceae bacterium]
MLAIIALGGTVGSVTRYLLGGMVQRLAGMAFPIGTLVVNVTGSFVAGFLLRHFMNDETQPLLRGALVIGFCGGFTTFSAFTAETMGLVEGGAYGKAATYIAASVGLSLAAVFAGFAAGALVSPHHNG